MDLTKTDNDFTNEEVEKINNFVKDGCPGLATFAADEFKINNMFGLYMAGKTYTEISRCLTTKKNLVLYMSAKMNWYEKRMSHINDIQNSMTQKISDTRIQSLNFIADLINFHHKFYGEQIEEYMATGDSSKIANLDLKSLGQYFKSIEMLEKILNPVNVTSGNSKKNGATININTPDGSTVRALDENTVEITPSATGEVLKALAKLKDEKKQQNK